MDVSGTGKDKLMVGVDDVYKGGAGNLLRAVDVRDNDLEVTIDGYEIRKFGEDTKIVLSFKGLDKRLALNVTNALRVGKAYGKEDLDKWIGKTLVLYLDTANYQGREVDAVRVRAPRGTKTVEQGPFNEANPPPREEGF